MASVATADIPSTSSPSPPGDTALEPSPTPPPPQVPSQQSSSANRDSGAPSSLVHPPSFPSASQRLHSASEVTWRTFKECVKGKPSKRILLFFMNTFR